MRRKRGNMNHNYLAEANKVLKDYGKSEMEIIYLILKKNENRSVIEGIACDPKDYDQMAQIYIDDDFKGCQYVPPWDYNIDDYLFYDLENGYEIIYMPLNEHYNLWQTIDELRDDIIHNDGLQKYLSYCQQHSITKETIDALNLEEVDIMDLYHEVNEKYEIIAQTSIGHRTIVLGHNEKLFFSYVTWSTTPTRERGYEHGNYFSNYNDAFKDYKNRCDNLLDSHLEFEKKKTSPKKEMKNHER